MTRIIITLFCLIHTSHLHAQDMETFQRKLFIHNSDTLPYRILLPLNYDASKKYPLILFLHGSGERGNDNELQLVHGARLFLDKKNREQFPAIVVFPQCAKDSYWSNQQVLTDSAGRSYRHFPLTEPPTKAMELLMEHVDQLLADYPVKRNQVYVGGLSMGGMGTFELVFRKPKTFAAAFPICGGGNPVTARIIRKTNWWIFHGEKDDVVLPVYSTKMVEALELAGAKVKYTLYPDANHNSWDPAFSEPGLLPWLFSVRK